MRFAHPYFLILIPLLGLLAWWLKKQGPRDALVTFSDLGAIAPFRRRRSRREPVLRFLRYAALVALIVALARPRLVTERRDMNTEVVDIMLTLDVSGSMRAEDFRPENRIQAAKEVVSDFIGGLTNDRVGLVVFAGQSFTQCPLTVDYGILLDILERVDVGMIEEDGTAVGAALATAANRLRDSEAKSKVIVLLTDGVNNRWIIDPVTAVRAAAALGITVHAIAIGKEGGAPIPIHDPIFGKRYMRNRDGSLLLTEVDEAALKEIADTAGGQFFRATDENMLADVYQRIWELEKTKISVVQYNQYSEKFILPLGIACLALLLEVGLANTVFRRIP